MKTVTILGTDRWVFTDCKQGDKFKVSHNSGLCSEFEVRLLENDNFVLVNDYVRLNTNSQNYGCLRIQTGILSQNDILKENYFLRKIN